MNHDFIPVGYQAFYIVIPTISIIGNAFIVYITIRSNSTIEKMYKKLYLTAQILPAFVSALVLVIWILAKGTSAQQLKNEADISLADYHQHNNGIWLAEH
ncbi:hypothetical protein KIN20_015447 [Parelaphostrongylus tenuis]|uniref:G-protein coupled receptors family 1 profile domain-containing protein n=1 Tax=Parelaphostrongylus tenuis TaxID=148309 RepID=A0AAD5MG28_PARTN|nr:hypothetical protein KIN20_015447 [Parelaphostrongylus tenuis]